MAFELPPLPYDEAALEPYIDAATIRLNRERHALHVEKGNRHLAGTAHEGNPPEVILANLDALTHDQQLVIRPHSGGHYNHSLLWETMSPDGGGAPEGPLAKAIESAFGSVDGLKDQLKQAAYNRFAAGWAWLVHGPDGLAVTHNRNEDNPLLKSLTPLLGIDMWEHAYLLTYQLDKGAYIDGFWHVIDWSRVAERHEAALPAASAAGST